MKQRIGGLTVACALLLGTAACTNPYDPAQRAVGGGLIGAGAGAAIGAAAAGGSGAATGAIVGGALGAVTGVLTTPPPPPPPPHRVAYRRCGWGWHWVRPHADRFGRWVPGHCSPNR
jgi:hypothetical protein